MIKKIAEMGGYVGMAIVHCSTLPTLLKAVQGQDVNLPESSFVIMMVIGLLLFFFRAVAQNDRLYILSNGIGLAFNVVMLWLVLLA